MGDTIAFDPAALATGRTELSLNGLGLAVRQEGADWGESQINVEMVRQLLDEGVTDRYLPAVEMTIPIMVRPGGGVNLAEAAHKLQQKVGLIRQEGDSWIERGFEEDGGFAGGVAYRVHAATLSGLQGWMMGNRQVAPDVTLKVTRSPLCYALEEIEGEVFEETKARELVWELSEVLGSAPGLIRLKVTNDNTEAHWRTLTCAMESRDHPQDETKNTTAKLAYDAIELTPKAGSTEAERETTKVIRNSALTAGWLTILDSEIEGVGHMTHKGQREIKLRVWDPGTEAGDVQLKLLWRPLGAVSWSENEIVGTPLVDDWAIMDLGEAIAEVATLGGQRWEFQVQARAVSGSGAIDIHRTRIEPTEQWVELTTPGETQAAELASTKSPGTVATSGKEKRGRRLKMRKHPTMHMRRCLRPKTVNSRSTCRPPISASQSPKARR